MKIRILSDLHLEFGPLELEDCGEDVLIAAGDIDLSIRGFKWLSAYAQRARNVPVIYVPGNHEFYREDWPSLRRVLRDASIGSTVHVLDDDGCLIDGVQFFGATLWTDYALTGNAAFAMNVANWLMTDHSIIMNAGRPFVANDARLAHEESVVFLRDYVHQSCSTTVVVTHHLPSARSINAKYIYNSWLNSAYASNLDDLIESSSADLWVHGHTHDSCDYAIGGTRVVCNPRGYYPDDLNPNFNPNLIIEV